MEVLGAIIVGLTIISNCIEVESPASILIPTIGTLLLSLSVALKIIGAIKSLGSTLTLER
jgi:hypothetical protein